MLGTIWFLLWGVLWAVYFMLDGSDLGLGTVMPAVAKSEEDRKLVYRAMSPFWDGNEVWLITAGGVTFAAFPGTYAVLFSGLYTPLMLILFALILRGVTFAFRGKVDDPRWRNIWDLFLVLGSFLPALLLGVAFANLFKGLPIDGEGIYQGTLFTLLNPYGIAGGLLFVAIFAMHGSLWLTTKTEGELQERGGAWAKKIWPLVLVLAVIFLLASQRLTNLYDNYLARPVLFLIPATAVLALLATRIFMAMSAWWPAWGASALTIVSTTLFGVIGLYPNLIPSSLDPDFSMTVANSSSSPLTLKIMLAVALTFVPIVIAYQIWVHFLFKDRLTDDEVAYEERHY
uniref:Cytochrome d ubiquinol oxidase subunit II n=1 Tax=Desulfobacca acetoxidans TaxID=60893 RepID=A0A7C3Z9C7_9BACT